MHHRRRLARTVALVALGLALAGAVLMGGLFGAEDDAGDTDGSAGAATTLRVSLTEFAFDPDPIVLPSGDGARLEVVNEGTIAHDLLINELGKGTPDLTPGQSMVIDLSDQPAGTYRVVCDIAGHTEAGMVTELTLT